MADPIAVRERIIELATDFADDHCHYVWGACGATPGGQDGSRGRPGQVNLVTPARTDPANPAVFAACCGVDGMMVCAGRYDEANGGIEGGRPANPSDADLIAYLSGLDATDADSWEPYFDWFSPRIAIEKGKPPYLVWGEDCRDIRHFDCVGLVNYCYDTAMAELVPQWADRPWHLSIAQYNDPISGTFPVSNGSLIAGDILTRGNHHIGLYVGDGDGSPDNPGTVVQAEQTSTGLQIRDYVSGTWDARRRLADGVLS
jgi:NlpC/P60 family